MNGIQIGALYPLSGRVGGVSQKQPAAKASNLTDKPFSQLLQEQQSAVKFSQHAEQRIRQRGIQLKPETITKLANAFEQAASKGAVDSLIVMRDVAFIVNVPNRTVITALDHAQMADTVFTQIDSAVILN